MAATKLPFEIKTYTTSRESNTEFLMQISDFMVNYMLKILKDISEECIKCLTLNEGLKKKKADPVHHRFG